MKTFRYALAIGIATLATVAACTADSITSAPTQASLALKPPALLQCPVNETTSSTAMVGPLGGVVTLGDTRIEIPAGALLSDATVTVTMPKSQFMEVDISVEGVQHFIFELPVVVTLSYARCSRNNISTAPLGVWYIDSETKDLLEPMGGIDDKLLRTITFTTGHLSGYAVAN